MLYIFVAFYLQYPKEPPHVCAVESKGLDENRQAYLISSIQNKAKELSDYPMLVTLCEVFLVFWLMHSREPQLFMP
jgi:E3 ubiquitin-protein ligase RNF25